LCRIPIEICRDWKLNFTHVDLPLTSRSWRTYFNDTLELKRRTKSLVLSFADDTKNQNSIEMIRKSPKKYHFIIYISISNILSLDLSVLMKLILQSFKKKQTESFEISTTTTKTFHSILNKYLFIKSFYGERDDYIGPNDHMHIGQSNGCNSRP